ncbi:hypothetical protein KKF81_00765 [Candidatus Micrarchaeota archaeon]|nr:hypothetical protein [Candidatus Micrarchaeota archaeon]MBU1165451.1 hypothetical protein [Candidatus Micrarchaeota archaeon]MBU1887432.1 hypothetical protein [Candidatus Micrarchaeota archaeon]
MDPIVIISNHRWLVSSIILLLLSSGYILFVGEEQSKLYPKYPVSVTIPMVGDGITQILCYEGDISKSIIVQGDTMKCKVTFEGLTEPVTGKIVIANADEKIRNYGAYKNAYEREIDVPNPSSYDGELWFRVPEVSYFTFGVDFNNYYPHVFNDNETYLFSTTSYEIYQNDNMRLLQLLFSALTSFTVVKAIKDLYQNK